MISLRIKIVKSTLVSLKCVTNSMAGPGTDRGKQSYTKAQRNTAKRRQRRKKSSNNIVSFQKTSGKKYIKNLSNKKVTDAEIKFISRGLKFILVNKIKIKNGHRKSEAAQKYTTGRRD